MGSSDSKSDNNDDNPDKASELPACATCKGYLSCGPVQILEDGRSTCGRCKETNGVTNVELEAILKTLLFPCRFKSKGCKIPVKFDQAVQHEDICKYRIYSCPSTSSCQWEGPACETYQHFKKNHKSNCLNESAFKLDIKENSMKNLVFSKNDDLIIIQYNYVKSKNILYLAVSYYPFNAHKEILCNFGIFNDKDQDLNVHLKKYTCQPYYHMIDVPNMIKISMQDYLKILDNPDVVLIKIDFKEENK